MSNQHARTNSAPTAWNNVHRQQAPPQHTTGNNGNWQQAPPQPMAWNNVHRQQAPPQRPTGNNGNHQQAPQQPMAWNNVHRQQAPPQPTAWNNGNRQQAPPQPTAWNNGNRQQALPQPTALDNGNRKQAPLRPTAWHNGNRQQAPPQHTTGNNGHHNQQLSPQRQQPQITPSPQRQPPSQVPDTDDTGPSYPLGYFASWAHLLEYQLEGFPDPYPPERRPFPIPNHGIKVEKKITQSLILNLNADRTEYAIVDISASDDPVLLRFEIEDVKWIEGRKEGLERKIMVVDDVIEVRFLNKNATGAFTTEFNTLAGFGARSLERSGMSRWWKEVVRDNGKSSKKGKA